MKNLKYIFSILVGIFITGSIVFGATILFPTGGGTGQGTLPTGQLIYGNGLGKVGSVATTTASCSGSASCTPFTVIGSSPITISATGGSGGSGNIATSAPGVISSLLYFTTGGATPEKVSPVATTTLTATPPIALSNAISVIGSTPSVATCNVASGSQPGCLSSADWTTFNNKGSGTVTAVSVASANGFTGSSSGGATPALTLTTSISGLLKGNGTAISAGANGTDYTLITAQDCTGTGHVLSVTAAGVFTCSADAGGGSVTGTTGQSVYMSGTNTAVGTSTIFIDTLSRVGIGTTTPNAALTIQPTLAAPMGIYIASTSPTFNGSVFEVDGATGFTGLGTTSPRALLSVNPNGIGSGIPIFLIGSTTRGLFDMSATGISTFRPMANAAGVFNVSQANGGSAVFSVDTNASVVNFNTMEGMTNASVKVYSNVQNNAGGASVTLGNDPSNQKNPTSGVSEAVAIIDTQNASSGTGEVNHLEIRGVVGQTGTASGIIRGALITPTLNTAVDYRAVETAAYTFNLNISTTTLRSILLNQFTIASSTATTVTNAYQQQIAGAPKASTNVTISTSTALFIGAGAVNGGGTVTKAYGLQVFAPTGATNNYSAQFTGDVQTAGGNPTLSSCGTSPSIRGTDTAGEVTVGSVAATGCTISFTTTKAFAPSCMVTEQTGSVVNAFSYTISTTAITVTQTGLTGIKLNYRCDQLTQ